MSMPFTSNNIKIITGQNCKISESQIPIQLSKFTSILLQQEEVFPLSCLFSNLIQISQHCSWWLCIDLFMPNHHLLKCNLVWKLLTVNKPGVGKRVMQVLKAPCCLQLWRGSLDSHPALMSSHPAQSKSMQTAAEHTELIGQFQSID